LRALKDFGLFFLLLPAVMYPVAVAATAFAGVLALEAIGVSDFAPGEVVYLAMKVWPLALAAALYAAFWPGLLVLLFSTDLKRRFPQRGVFCLAVGTLYFAGALANSAMDAWQDDLSMLNIGYGVGLAFAALSGVVVSVVYGPVAWTLLDRFGKTPEAA